MKSPKPFRSTLDAETLTLLGRVKTEIRTLGRRSLKDAIEIGRLLDGAHEILRGRFSVWVRHECGIDPRTALAYRKLHRMVDGNGERKARLAGSDIKPSAAMVLATAPDEVIDRVINNSYVSGINITIDVIRDEIRKHNFASNQTASPSRPSSEASKSASIRRAKDTLRRATSLAAKRLENAIAALDTPNEFTPSLLQRLMAEAIEELSSAESAAGTSTDQSPKSLPATPREQQNLVTEEFDDRPTVVEICAGAGGMAYGLESAGFRHLKLVEKNKTACRTLIRNGFPEDAVVRRDIKKFDGTRLRGHVDLLAGGPPCQPFSAGGNQQGPNDRKRRDLFMEAIRLVREIEPKAFLFENVVGMTHAKFTEYRAHIIKELEASGYEVTIGWIYAPNYGLDQNRCRIVFLGLRPEYARFYRWPRIDGVKHLQPVTELLSDLVLETGHPNAEAWVRDASTEVFLNETRGGFDRVLRRAATIVAGSGSKSADFGGDNGGAELLKKLSFETTRVYSMEEVKANGGIGSDPDLIPLTPEMLATLQGFPRSWIFEGHPGRQRLQIGNAVPPVFAQWLGIGIRAALERTFIDSPCDVVRRRPNPMRELRHPMAGGQSRHLGFEPNPDFAPFDTKGTQTMLRDFEVEKLGLRMGSPSV